MKSLCILVPVYRELQWLESGFSSTWEWVLHLPDDAARRLSIVFCVWTSCDDDLALVQKLEDLKATFKTPVQISIISGSGPKPSVAASLHLALQAPHHASQSRFTMVCPIDCSPTAEGLMEILQKVEKAEENSWFVFRKTYHDSPSRLMKISAWSQNSIFSPLFGFHCWTHLFVIPTTVLGLDLTIRGFLEDLSLNRAVTKRLGRPFRLSTRAHISSRRYTNRGAGKQILSNIYIFIAYQLNRRSADRLRRVHEG